MPQRFLGICVAILLTFNVSACKFPVNSVKKVVREMESPPEQIISHGRSSAEWCLYCPVEADWSKTNLDRLAAILDEYGFQVGREQIDEVMMKHAWQTNIFPKLRDEWAPDVDSTGKEYWDDVGNACYLHSVGQMEPRELAAHILVGEIDSISSGRMSKILFAAEFVKPGIVLEDALCLVARKVFETSSDTLLDGFGAPKTASHCMESAAKFIRESDPYAGQIKDGCR